MQTPLHRGVILASALLVASALPLAAQSVRDQMLVSTAWLTQHARSVNVLHVGDRYGYDAGHIPGAVLVDMASLLVDRDGTPNELPPIDALEKVFRSAGLGSRGRIAVYSTDPLLAARAWFTLDYLGQGDRVALLDGGFAKWVADGCATSRDPVVPRPGSFQAGINPHAVVRLPAMRKLVLLEELFASDLVLLEWSNAGEIVESTG